VSGQNRFRVAGKNRFQVSGVRAAAGKKTVGLIEKETLEKRISNIE
jgi:hypothetical protein